jgi:hypothetical protein
MRPAPHRASNSFHPAYSHPEIFDDVLIERMDLQRQIAPLHGVEEIKTNWKLRPESRVYAVADQFTRMVQHQILCRNLDFHTGHIQQKAVFFRNTIKAPRVVRRTVRQITHFTHPLSAPGAGVEKRYYPKRSAHCGSKTCAKRLASAHLGRGWIVGIQEIVDPVNQRLLDAVRYTSVDKEGALIFRRRGFTHVSGR